MSVNVQECFEEWLSHQPFGEDSPAIDLSRTERGNSYVSGQVEWMWRAFYSGYVTHEQIVRANVAIGMKNIGLVM